MYIFRHYMVKYIKYKLYIISVLYNHKFNKLYEYTYNILIFITSILDIYLTFCI